MYSKYHRLITTEALNEQFSPAALRLIIKANIRTDNGLSNVWHPEQHFTENAIEMSLAYIEEQRNKVVATLRNEKPISQTWQAFGRLLHTAQDFYAHSNYVHLWASQFMAELLPPSEIKILDPTLLANPKLHTARAYRPIGTFGNLPFVGHWLFPFLPADAHAKMNLDGPARGPLFVYAFAAATKRTIYEFNKTISTLQQAGQAELLIRFTEKNSL
jgi:hypothetical protein